METRLPAELERGRGERGADAGAWGPVARTWAAPPREEAGTKERACGLRGGGP